MIPRGHCALSADCYLTFPCVCRCLKCGRARANVMVRRRLRDAFAEACRYAETRAELEGWTLTVALGRGGTTALPGVVWLTAIHVHGAPGWEHVVDQQRALGRRFRTLRVYQPTQRRDA